MRNQAATMAAPMRPAMMPSRRYRDLESMGGLLSSLTELRILGSGVPPSGAESKPGEPGRLFRVGRQTDDHLAEVVAREEAEESLGGVLDAVHDCLFALDASRLEPAADLGQELGVESEVVGNDEALHQRPVADQGEEVARAGVWRVEVVLRDHAAERNTGEGIEKPQHGVQDRAAHVLEVDVDALGTGLPERVEDVGRFLVAYGGVGAELAREIRALVVRPGRADD